MTEEQAHKAANIIMGVAAAGAAFYILRTPRLRRMAWQLARTAIGTAGPAWLMAEARRAWDGNGTSQAPSPSGGIQPDQRRAI